MQKWPNEKVGIEYLLRVQCPLVVRTFVLDNNDDLTLGSKHDANMPLNIQPTLKLMSRIQDFQGLIEPLEEKFKELVERFDEWAYTFLPDILNEHGDVKPLQQWKDHAIQVILTWV